MEATRKKKSSALQDTKQPAFKLDNGPRRRDYSSLQDTEPESSAQIIIALDFGKSSSAAYKFTTFDNSDLPITIREWPGCESNSVMVPTEVAYNAGDPASFTWGHQEHKSHAINPVFLLDPSQPTPLFVPQSQFTKKELASLEKTPLDVTVDFLGAVFTHVVGQIESTFFKDYVRMHQKTFVVTFPETYTDTARDSLLQAAKKAGVWPIISIGQYESIAKYCLHMLDGEKDAKHSAQVGDAVTICDVGSGTVGLTSYGITKLAPLKLKQLIPSTGGLAGSLMISKRFEEHIKNVVGDEEFYTLRKQFAFERAMDIFNHEVKPNFINDENKSWFVCFLKAKLKDVPEHELEADFLHLKCPVVRDIFEPVIRAIEKLLQEQIDLVNIKRLTGGPGVGKLTEVKTIFLVGEFGGYNQYLKDRVTAQFPNIRIVQPPDALVAAVSGAVLSQLPLQQPAKEAIIHCVAMKHYGIAGMRKYYENVDKGQKRIWDPIFGNQVNKITWYIDMGQEMYSNYPIRIPITQILPLDYNSSDLIFETKLIECNEIVPPIYPPSTQTKINCTLKVDLSGDDVDRTKFKRVIGVDCQPYKEVCYEILITVSEGMVAMGFEVEVDGHRAGSILPIYN